MLRRAPAGRPQWRDAGVEVVEQGTLRCVVRAELTPAERETALLAATGRSSKDIAADLVLSVRTVENRLQRVYEKLGVSSRTELSRRLQ